MPKPIEVQLDGETGTYHLFLDGEDKGPIDEESLRKTVEDLYLHFTMFKEKPVDNEGIDVDEELRDLEETLDDVEN